MPPAPTNTPPAWASSCRPPASLRTRRGTVMILFLVLTMMMIGIFAATLNIGQMSQDRIRVQQAADAAAMGVTRLQGLALGFITITNDLILWALADAPIDLTSAIAHFASLDIGGGIGELIKIGEDISNITTTKGIQDKVLLAVPIAAESVAEGIGAANGAQIALVGQNFNLLEASCDVLSPGMTSDLTGRVNQFLSSIGVPSGVDIDMQSSVSLSVDRPIWTLWLIQVHDAEVKEKATVVAITAPQNLKLTGFMGTGTGHKLIAMGSSKPYYILGSPRSSDMTGWRFLEDVLPGPWWQSRMVHTGEMTIFPSTLTAQQLEDRMTGYYVLIGATYATTVVKSFIAGFVEEALAGYLKSLATDAENSD